MRSFLILPLFFNAIYVVSVSADDDKVVCPTSVPRNDKHSWEVEKFLGSWSGDEIYSHTQMTFIDTCLRVKISEVDELGDETIFKRPTDLYNYQLSFRHLKLKFAYQSHDVIYPASLNMTNVAFWKGENFTVQVLRFEANRLTLTICESGSKLFTIVLKENDDAEDLKADANEEFMIKSILGFKKLKVHSAAELNVNCTAESEGNLSAGNRNFSFISIWILVFSRLLLI